MNQKTRDELAGILERLEEIKSDEEGKRDNMEENFSETEKFQKIEEDIEKLDDAVTALDDLCNS